MSVKAMAWAFEQNLDDAQTKLVLLALCDHADDRNLCWPSHERLALKAACSTKTVQRKLNELESLGLLKRRRRQRETAIYQIAIDKKPLTGQFVRSKGLEPTNSLFEPTELCPPNHHIEPSIESNAPSARAGQPTTEVFRAEIGREENPHRPVPVDEPPKARLFREGKTALVSLGLSEERSGSVIGRWLKDKHDPVGILAAIEYAREQCAVSPVAYVTQILKGQTDGKPKTGTDETFRQLLERARELEDQAGIVRPSDRV